MLEGAHYTSFAGKGQFATEQDLEDWVISFYARMLAYYSKNIGRITVNKVKITPTLVKRTRLRYLTLLMGKYNVTNRRLPKINK